MAKFLDRANMRYGRLLVIKHNGKDERSRHLWLCKCDCGNEKIVVGDNLSSGKSNSCGCLKVEFLSRKGNQYGLYEDREIALLKNQYSQLKKRDRVMGFDCVIDFEYFVGLVKNKCRYCGLGHSKEIEDRLNESMGGKRLSNHILKCNGIDRIDSKKGYTKENSASCCKYCNIAKHTMMEDEFFKWVKRVYEYNF